MNSFSKYLQEYPDKCICTNMHREMPDDRVQGNPKSPIYCKKLNAEFSQPADEVLQKSTQTCIHQCQLHCSSRKHRSNRPKESDDRQSIDNRTFRCEQGSLHATTLKSKLLQELKPTRTFNPPSSPFEFDMTEPEGAEGDCWWYKNSKFGKKSTYKSDSNRDKSPSVPCEQGSRRATTLKSKLLQELKPTRTFNPPSSPFEFDMTEPEGAEGDCCLWYKNSKFGKKSTYRSESNRDKSPSVPCEQGSRRATTLKSKLLQELKPIRTFNTPSSPFEFDMTEPEGAEGDCWSYKNSKFGKKSTYKSDSNRDKSPSVPCEQGSRRATTLKSKLLQELKPIRTFNTPSSPFELDMTEPEGAEGDCLLYKNSKFGKKSTYKSDSNRDKSPSVRTNKTLSSGRPSQNESSKLLESARAFCRQTREEFEAKYVTTDSDSSRTVRSVITTNCGEQLRTVVRSQIKTQAQNEVEHNAVFDLPLLDWSVETDASALKKEQPPIPESASKQSPIPESASKLKKKQSPLPESASKHTPASSRLNEKSVESTAFFEDLVNSKVIAPVLRRVQRMYLNNLREEMSLMEDLERVPWQVGELFKSVDLEAWRGTVQK